MLLLLETREGGFRGRFRLPSLRSLYVTKRENKRRKKTNKNHHVDIITTLKVVKCIAR